MLRQQPLVLPEQHAPDKEHEGVSFFYVLEVLAVVIGHSPVEGHAALLALPPEGGAKLSAKVIARLIAQVGCSYLGRSIGETVRRSCTTKLAWVSAAQWPEYSECSSHSTCLS